MTWDEDREVTLPEARMIRLGAAGLRASSQTKVTVSGRPLSLCGPRLAARSASNASASSPSTPAGRNEIRRYQTQPGRRDEWVRYMGNVVIPYQQSKGMTITASFVDDEDPDGYVWIRRFDDEAHRAALYAATRDDPWWTDEIFPAVAGPLLIDRTVVTRAVPTSASALH